MERIKITVSTTLSADLQKTWDYWTQPEHIVNWNFASEAWHCPTADNDLKPGGKFKSTMASKDEKFSFDVEGFYDEVLDRQRITYTITDGRKVPLKFEQLGDKVKITETFEAENTHPEEMQRAGWQAILNNFKRYVETQ